MGCRIGYSWLSAILLCALGMVPVSAVESILAVEARVWFSPHGGCTEAIVAELGLARTQILVQAYSFTSTPIAKALKEAKDRGVDVRVILDKSQRTERYSGADFLAHAGIPVLIDEQPAIAHSKVMVIDRALVITGSFNFTSSAEERNVENLLVLRAPALAELYGKNWKDREGVSVPFVSKDQRP